MYEAPVKEEEKLKNYINEGWVKLNKVKCGSLGGGYLKWTKERCYKEALKYKTRTNFRKSSSSAYIRARKEGWLDEICEHMVRHVNQFI